MMVGLVFPCQFTLNEYVVFKTLIDKKTAHCPNQKPPLPNFGNLPQVGNQCVKALW